LSPPCCGYAARIVSDLAATDPEHLQSAAPFVPSTRSLKTLAQASLDCKGCPLYIDTTQTVFGKGPVTAPLILVGEQPGDVEDKRGIPFVGPAGAMLWQCLEDAGIDRHDVYTTNAVKHFKHETRGKRRLHKKPDTAEVEACHPWIDAELKVLKGRVIVALGAVAARSLLGRSVPIAASRGTRFEVSGRPTLVTYHPSAVLRADDRAVEVRAALVADLQAAQRKCTE
jgi:DNA polymerase